MDENVELANLAAILADRSRAAMMLSLMDGSSRSAGALALISNISASSASMHLTKLVRAGMLSVKREGRSKYYRISSPAMANIIEALGVASSVANGGFSSLRTSINPWRFARTCYDHLAGKLGVELALALQTRGYLRPVGQDFELMPAGKEWLRSMNIDWQALAGAKRPLATQCQDWTERRHHIAGELGAALLTRMLELRWLQRSSVPRLLKVSFDGELELKKLFRWAPSA